MRTLAAALFSVTALVITIATSGAFSQTVPDTMLQLRMFRFAALGDAWPSVNLDQVLNSEIGRREIKYRAQTLKLATSPSCASQRGIDDSKLEALMKSLIVRSHQDLTARMQRHLDPAKANQEFNLRFGPEQASRYRQLLRPDGSPDVHSVEIHNIGGVARASALEHLQNALEAAKIRLPKTFRGFDSNDPELSAMERREGEAAHKIMNLVAAADQQLMRDVSTARQSALRAGRKVSKTDKKELLAFAQTIRPLLEAHCVRGK